MIDRSRDLDDPRPTRHTPARPEARRRRRFGRRPAVEALEGRSLLSAAGSPDFSYAPGGARGFAAVEFSATAGQLVDATAQAVQSDGKDVVVGRVVGDVNALTPIDVTRLNADGTTDTTFGANGQVSLPVPATGSGKPVGVAVQADGKIVVLAQVVLIGKGTSYEAELYRLNSDGSVDTSFGTGGGVILNFTVAGSMAEETVPSALVIQGDGKILLGGSDGTHLAVARFNTDGTPDSTFGSSGQASIEFLAGTTVVLDTGVTGMAVQASGKIDVETTLDVNLNPGVGTEVAVGRLNADGSADTSFGTGGQVVLSGSTVDTAGVLAIQPDGKVLVTGTHTPAQQSQADPTHFDVYRLNMDGSVDTSFGKGGEATPLVNTRTLFSSLSHPATLNAIQIRVDGSILVAGSVISDQVQVTGPGPVVVGLNADGTPDVDFGSNGQAVLPGQPLGYSGASINGLAVQPGGKILTLFGGGVARLLASGGTNDFNEDGKSDPAVLLPNFQSPFVVYRPSGAAAGTPDVVTPFGTGGAGQTLPAPGAYDGYGVDELGVYLPALGAFGIRGYPGSGYGDRLIPIGQKGLGNSIPAPADYTGSGFTQAGVFEPGPADFVYAPSNLALASADVTVQFGAPGAGNSIPVPADYDGSGHDELGVYLPAIASFVYRPAGTAGPKDTTLPFGSPGVGNTIPVPGDYSGSGHTELGVYLPAIGGFAYRPYGTTGSKDVVVPFGMPGKGGSIPMPGDYDGSGHTELAVYMPSIDAFAYRPYGTTGSKDVIEYFGEPGAGNTIPFTQTGTQFIAGGGGGGGGGNAHASAVSAGWVDFVPDVAGPAKKGAAGQGRS